MSIVHVAERFAILDEQKYFQKVFEKKKVKMRAELFEITGKFMPDSQFEAIQRRGPTIGKKRCRPADEGSESEIGWIQKVGVEVKREGTSCGYFRKTEKTDNNKKAREAAKEVLDGFKNSLTREFHSDGELNKLLELQWVSRNSEDVAKGSWDEVALKGKQSSWLKFSMAGGVGTLLDDTDSEDVTFYTPPDAVFHFGDVRDVDEYAKRQGISFDLVIADPPWECRSVKRKKTYETSDTWHDGLHVDRFTSEDVLVCIWMTNRRGIERDLQKTLETWHMERIADWKWLKVTNEGDPVFDFDNPRHKVPFETLVFATKKSSKKAFALPETFCFASVPMAVHSHKPPIFEILKHFGVEFNRPLELFARNLLPGTTSVGYEPLLLQSEFVYTPE